jgi:hypothetical protein
MSSLSDHELALAASTCGWIEEGPRELRDRAEPICAVVHERARAAAPRNPLFLLLQPEFDTAAREVWLNAMTVTPLDDYGPDLYRDALEILEPMAMTLASEDLDLGLTPRDLAAQAANELLDWTFWGARTRVTEPCRSVDQGGSEQRDLCRRSLAAPREGWTHWTREGTWRAAEWRLELSERGKPIPRPSPSFVDYELRAHLLSCCAQQGAHPEFVRLRASQGERAAEDWLYRELGESPGH